MARFKCLSNMNAPAHVFTEPYDIEHLRSHLDYVEVNDNDEPIGPPRSEEREPWKMPVMPPTGGPTQPEPPKVRRRKGA
jgi:hypothetical protein